MIKRFLFPSPIATSLQTTHKSYFSKQRQSARRVQTIGFASNNIEDIKYHRIDPDPSASRLLLPCCFKKEGASSTGVVFQPRGRSRTIFGRAPCSPTLPIASPSKSVPSPPFRFPGQPHGEAPLRGGHRPLYPRHNPALLLASRRFLRNQSIVHEIYLIEGGKATEIVFKNKVKRKLFG